MKKIVSTIVLVAIVLFALCGCSSDTTVQDALKRCDKNVVLTASQDAELNISADVYEVFVACGETNLFTVDYVFCDKVDFSAEVVGGKVVVTETENAVFNAVNLAMVVRVPQNWCGNMSLQLKTGAFRVENLALKNLSVIAETGRVTVSNCTAEDIIVSVTTGAVSVDAAAKSLCVEAGTASVSVNGSFENSVYAKTTTGTVKLDCTTQNLFAKSNTGSVKFQTNATVVEVVVGTGSVRGKIDGKKENYEISVVKDTGSTNLQNKSGDGTHRLTVEAETASVDIDFEK